MRAPSGDAVRIGQAWAAAARRLAPRVSGGSGCRRAVTTFITAVRATLAEAEGAREPLLQRGLPETLLEEVAAAGGGG